MTRRRLREVRAITLDRVARRFGALFDGVDVAERLAVADGWAPPVTSSIVVESADRR